MFDLGIQELIVIFIVALIVFGPKRLPELGKTLGKGMWELRKAMEGIKEQMNAESDMARTLVEGSPELEEKKDETSADQGSAEAGKIDDTGDKTILENRKEDTVDDR